MSVILKIVLPLVLTLSLLDCSSSDTKKTDKLPKIDAKTQITYPVNSAEDPVKIDVPVVPPVVPVPFPPIPVDGSARTGNEDNDDSCNDSDADGVCDTKDKCQGSDDRIDFDKDGWPEACDCDDENADVYPGIECNPSVTPNNQECRHLICRVSTVNGDDVANCANEPKEDFTLCGTEPLGLCDKQDFCYSGLCVDDQQPITYQCNNYVSECDVPDYCDGINDDCPNTYVVAGIPCGNAPARGALCDAQDECDGAGNCIDEVQDSGFICGVNNGSGCDVTDVCNGFDKDCFNTVLASGTLCGNSAQGECDLHDVCNSQGECLDIKRLPGAICEFSHGICQPGSTCDGLSNDCPFASPTPAGVPCGPNNSGICTGQGRCTLDSCPNAMGTGTDGDGDGFSTECDCDDTNPMIFPNSVCSSNLCSQNLCNADTKACDIVRNLAAGTICGPDQPAGSCLKNPVCDANGTCLNNEFQASDYPCRISTGVCDAEEFCTGLSGVCPIDSFIQAGHVCGSENDPCLSPGMCDGTSATCSGSVNAPDGDTNASCTAYVISTDNCNAAEAGSIICSQGVGYCYADNSTGNNENNLGLFCYGDNSNNINGSGNDDNLGYSVAAYGNYVASGNISYDLPADGGDDVGAVYVNNVPVPAAASSASPVIIYNPTFTPSGIPGGAVRPTEGSTEYFGWSVALHGDYLIVGAPNADYYYDRNTDDPCDISVCSTPPSCCIGNKVDDTGAAYIFVRSGLNWAFQAKLQGVLVRSAGNLYPDDVGVNDSDLHANEHFGWDVAINGDYAVVSAPFAEGAHNDVGNVRVYHRSGSTWSHLQLIGTPIDQNDDSRFGYSLAISPDGKALIVGTPRYDNSASDSNDNRGAAYLYFSNGTGGTFTLAPTGVANPLTGNSGGDQLGFDVSISNKFALIGIPHNDTASNNNGQAEIRAYNTTGFLSDAATFNGPVNRINLYFGTSVSIGRTDDHGFVVGGPDYDRSPDASGGGTRNGLFAIYSIDQSMSTITATDYNLASYVDQNGDTTYVAGSSEFGFSVATDNNIIAVGAPFNDAPSGDSGSTSLFFYPY